MQFERRAQGRCCSAACTGTCKSCAISGSEGRAGTCPTPGPAGQCARRGHDDLRPRRHVRRHGRLPQIRRQHRVRPRHCAGGTELAGCACTAAGTCAPGTLQNCRPYVCGAHGLPTSCATTAECAAGYTCIGNVCTKKSNGSTCTMPASASRTTASRGSAATPAARAPAGVQPDRGDGNLLPDRRGQAPVAARQCRHGRHVVRHRRQVQRRGCLPQLRRGHRVRRRELHGVDAVFGADLRRRRRVPAPDHETRARRTMCERRCRTSCTTTAATARPGNTCVAMSCGKIPVGGTCPSGVERTARPTSASGRVLQHGVHRYLHGVPSRAASARARRFGRASRRSWPPSARRPRRRPAATTDVQRRRRVPQTRHGTQCAAATCTGSTYTPPQLCDGAGVCAAATTQSCGAFQCDTAGRAVAGPTARRRALRGAEHLQRRHLLAQADRRDLHRGKRVRLGLLRAGPLLRQACTGTCKSCALAAALGTCCNVANGTAPTSPPSARHRGDDVWPRRHVQRRGRVPLLGDGDAVCSGELRRIDADPRAPATARASAARSPARCAIRTSATRATRARRRAPRHHRLRRPEQLRHTSCGKLPIAAPCTMDECNSRFCAQGVCCATACTGTCASCALAGTVGTCTRFQRDRTRWTSAPTRVGDLRYRRRVQRQRRLPQVRLGHDLRRRRAARPRRSRRRRRATRAARASRRRTRRARPTRAARARARPLAPATPTAPGPPYVCIGHDVAPRTRC